MMLGRYTGQAPQTMNQEVPEKSTRMVKNTSEIKVMAVNSYFLFPFLRSKLINSQVQLAATLTSCLHCTGSYLKNPALSC